MSCPQQPCSAPVDAPVASFMESVGIWSSSFPAAFHSFPAVLLFPRPLPSHDVPKVGQLQFCHFCLQRCLGLNSRTHAVSTHLCTHTHEPVYASPALVPPSDTHASHHTISDTQHTHLYINMGPTHVHTCTHTQTSKRCWDRDG